MEVSRIKKREEIRGGRLFFATSALLTLPSSVRSQMPGTLRIQLFADRLTGGAKVFWIPTDAGSTLAHPSAITDLLVFGHAGVISQVAAAVVGPPALVTYALIALTPPVTTAESAREKSSLPQQFVEKQGGPKQCILTCCHVWGRESSCTRRIAPNIVPLGLPSPGTHKIHRHTAHYCCTQDCLGQSDSCCHQTRTISRYKVRGTCTCRTPGFLGRCTPGCRPVCAWCSYTDLRARRRAQTP